MTKRHPHRPTCSNPPVLTQLEIPKGDTAIPAPVTYESEALVPTKEAARLVGLSLPAFYRAVAQGRLPAPVYPMPRAARWYPSELRAALQATRMKPAAAVEARMRARAVAA